MVIIHPLCMQIVLIFFWFGQPSIIPPRISNILMHWSQTEVGIPIPNMFLILFSQFFPKFGWEHFIALPFSIPKVGNKVFIPIPNPKNLEFDFSFKFKNPTLKNNIGNFIWKPSFLYTPFFSTRHLIYPKKRWIIGG